MITDRRSILAGIALVAATPAFAQSASPTSRATPTDIKMAAQFYSAVIPRAEMSLSTSQLGVEKATNHNAHEFAGFELGEAITVNMVLKDILVTVPPMDKSAEKALVEKMTADKGAAFARAYIAFQLENHEFLPSRRAHARRLQATRRDLQAHLGRAQGLTQRLPGRVRAAGPQPSHTLEKEI